MWGSTGLGYMLFWGENNNIKGTEQFRLFIGLGPTCRVYQLGLLKRPYKKTAKKYLLFMIQFMQFSKFLFKILESAALC